MPEWDASASSLTPYQHPFKDNSPLALSHPAITGTHFYGHPLLREPTITDTLYIYQGNPQPASRFTRLNRILQPKVGEAQPRAGLILLTGFAGPFVAFDCDTLAKQMSVHAG